MAEGGDGAGLGQRIDRLVRALGLRGERHRRERSAGQLRELAHQLGIAADQMGGVLRPATRLGEEGALQMDRGDLPVAVETRELGDAVPQRVGVGRDEGGDERGRAVATVLVDRGEHLLRRRGVGEGRAAAAVAVEVHESGEDEAVVVEGARGLVLRGLLGGTGPEDPLAAHEDERIGDHPLLEHGGASHGEVDSQR